MPELPEVETIVNGIRPIIKNLQIEDVIIRTVKLRWPINLKIIDSLKNAIILDVCRRGKFVLIKVKYIKLPLKEHTIGYLLIHLGMSGSFRICTFDIKLNKHDHVDFIFKNKLILRFNDPRRFGAIMFIEESDPFKHGLLKKLGVEPLSSEFNEEYLLKHRPQSKTPIKAFIMDSQHVVGIGNIYATEALFIAKIHPNMPKYLLTRKMSFDLINAIKEVLLAAIEKGGTTLKDFTNEEGKPGYFSQSLKLYGKAGSPCPNCLNILKTMKIRQRSTVYCPNCQISPVEL